MTLMLSEEQIQQKITTGLQEMSLQGKRVLVIIPDPTRTMPLPLFFRTIVNHLRGKASQVDFLVALGTHPALSDAELLSLVGLSAAEKAEAYSDGLFQSSGCRLCTAPAGLCLALGLGPRTLAANPGTALHAHAGGFPADR